MPEPRSIDEVRNDFIHCLEIHVGKINDIEKLEEVIEKCLKLVEPDDVHISNIIGDIVNTV